MDQGDVDQLSVSGLSPASPPRVCHRYRGYGQHGGSTRGIPDLNLLVSGHLSMSVTSRRAIPCVYIIQIIHESFWEINTLAHIIFERISL